MLIITLQQEVLYVYIYIYLAPLQLSTCTSTITTTIHMYTNQYKVQYIYLSPFTYDVFYTRGWMVCVRMGCIHCLHNIERGRQMNYTIIN